MSFWSKVHKIVELSLIQSNKKQEEPDISDIVYSTGQYNHE